MDYSDINNYLQNLELSQKNTEKKFQEKLNNDNCNIYSKDELMKDNKNQDLLLHRELSLNNNGLYNFQVANPQRFAENSEKKINNNEKINNYTFNNTLQIRNDYTCDNRLTSLNIDSRQINENKNKINNNLTNRELMPTKANFNLSFDN
jgi:hypothetical protein